MARSARRVAAQVGRVLIALVSAATLVATGYGWSVYREVSGGFVTSGVLDDRTPAGLDEEFTALLVGIDSRTDAAGNPLPDAVLAELRAGIDEGQFNTDTLILLHVPAGAEAQAEAISIPRDSFVQVAGDLGRHKINAAYRRGMLAAEEELQASGLTGPALERASREAGRRTLVETVEDLTGATIDHLAEVNLAGFMEITDAVGGVPVCLNTAVREERSGIDLPAGRQVLSGGDALAFVRQRRDLPGGDLDRVIRQQAFLAGLAGTTLSSGALTDPARLDRLIGAVTRYVVLDRGWDLAGLISQLRRATGEDITFRTIPTGDPALETAVDGVAVEVDPDEVRAFVAEVLDGRERLTAPLTTDPGPAPPTVRPSAVPFAPPPSGATPFGPTTTPVPLPEPVTAATVPCVD